MLFLIKKSANNYTKRPLAPRFQILYREDKAEQHSFNLSFNESILGIVCDNKTFRINK